MATETLKQIHQRGETSFCHSITFEMAGVHLAVTKLSLFICQRNHNLLLLSLMNHRVCNENHFALR